MSLSEYTKAELLEELVRRQNAAGPGEVLRWCDDCAHFRAKPSASDDYNPCGRGHEMRFHAPHDMAQVQIGQYGFYRLVCSDRA